MSWKDNFIAKYGIEAYERRLENTREYNKLHRDQRNAYDIRWRENHPDQQRETYRRWRQENHEKIILRQKEWREQNPKKVKEVHEAACRKGGKYYEHARLSKTTGIQGEREKVRKRHQYRWGPYKRIIAPESQIHHEWIPKTAEYTGMALVEADQHMHGFVDVIQILGGKITLLTEEEIRKQKCKNKGK